MPAGEGQIVLYRTLDGGTPVEVRLVKESVWLTQKQMAVLFDTERSVITKHLRNVFATGELGEKKQCAKDAHSWLGQAHRMVPHP